MLVYALMEKGLINVKIVVVVKYVITVSRSPSVNIVVVHTYAINTSSDLIALIVMDQCIEEQSKNHTTSGATRARLRNMIPSVLDVSTISFQQIRERVQSSLSPMN